MNNQSNNTILKLQETIESQYPREIRLEKTLKNRNESLFTFISTFLMDWNNTRKTIYVDNKEMQTDIGKRRSLGDIYMICKYYYHACTLKDVLKILYIDLSKHDGFVNSKCDDIHKRVWRYDKELPSITYNLNIYDEYGNRPEDYYKLLKSEL